MQPHLDGSPQQQLASLLAAQGLTICHAFPVQLFNRDCPEPSHRLPTFDSGQAGQPPRASTLAFVIGNTNELWPHFTRHLASQADAAAADSEWNPLDDYVEGVVARAVQQCCQQQQQCKFALRFSHHTEPGRFVNLMRAAQVSGLAYLSSTTHLCMHPVFGPWFALRAVAVLDCDGPDPATFRQLPCPHPDVEAEAAHKMKELEALGGFSAWQQHWREWAALRALGGKHTDPRWEYSADQLEYHYTKNKDVLRRAVAALQPAGRAADTEPQQAQQA